MSARYFKQILFFVLLLLLQAGQSSALSLDPWLGKYSSSKEKYFLVLFQKNKRLELQDSAGEMLLKGRFKIDSIDGEIHLTLNYDGDWLYGIPEIQISVGPVRLVGRPDYREVQLGNQWLFIEHPLESREPIPYESCGKDCWIRREPASVPDKIRKLFGDITETLSDVDIKTG